MITVLRIVPQKDEDYGNTCFIVGHFPSRDIALLSIIRDFTDNYDPSNKKNLGGHIEMVETKDA